MHHYIHGSVDARLTGRQWLMCSVALASVGLCAGAYATPLSEHGFAGTWHVTSSAPGGLADVAATPTRVPLVGKTLTFEPTSVLAPHPLGCDNAVYEVYAMPAEGLFQGGLGDTAKARAEALDLSPTAAPTLMVGCDGGLFDYHRTKGNDGTGQHLLIMLDGMIYTLERGVDPAGDVPASGR